MISKLHVIALVFYVTVLTGAGLIAVSWHHRKKIYSPNRKKR